MKFLNNFSNTLFRLYQSELLEYVYNLKKE